MLNKHLIISTYIFSIGQNRGMYTSNELRIESTMQSFKCLQLPCTLSGVVQF